MTASRVACEHTCLSLETASAEMNAVASLNARVRDPVYHVVVSWPADENPTDEQAFACGRHALAAVGMGGHQYVFAVHRDTSHVHLHMAVNRVHPDTFVAVYPERDYFKLSRAMRELELLHGWKHDKGPHAVFERNGITVIDWASKQPDATGKQPVPAAAMERHADQESLFSFVRGEPRAAVVAALKQDTVTWQDLHEVLARFGLELREKGQGFAIYDRSSSAETPVKASDMHESLSKSRLTRRLGPFEPSRGAWVSSAPTYDKHRAPKRDPAKRELRRQERADARRMLRARYDEYRTHFVYRRLAPDEIRARYAELQRHAKSRRAQVRESVGDWSARKAMLSVIAFETLRARYALREQIRIERDALRTDPLNKRLPYRQWVEREAAKGDASAISQLRGFAYQERRQEHAPASGNGMVYDEDLDPIALEIPGMRYTVRRDGSVMYLTDRGREAFVDFGSRIVVLDDEVEFIERAIRLAEAKTDAKPMLLGSADFKARVVAILEGHPTPSIRSTATKSKHSPRPRPG